MKTKIIAARLTPLDINKIGRYFEKPTIRELLEASILLSEEIPYFREKIKEVIKRKK